MSGPYKYSSKSIFATFAGKFFIVVFAALVFANYAGAQTVSFLDEYGKRVKASGLVSPLGSEMFGEKVSLYNGQTEFTATDISVPGNNSLPVELGRRLVISQRQYEEFLGGFGEWDIDIPYIKATVQDIHKWSPNNRCSSGQPPYTSSFVYTTDQIWHGTHMHIPGDGDSELLVNNSAKMPKPSDGVTYPWVTKGRYQIRCLPTTANGYPGEGFLAISPNGTKYYFNYGIELKAAKLGPKVVDFNSPGSTYYMGRLHVFLLATKVEDRFGNAVNYTYSGKKLTGISSSDGRSIGITYLGNNIKTATAAGKTWTYQYAASPQVTLDYPLKALTLPDGSKWTFSVLGDLAITPGESPAIEGMNDTCSIPVESGYGGISLSITHPSGATGKFDLDYTQHSRNGTPNLCSYDGNINFSHQVIPNTFENYTLLRKTISGPGVSAQIWNYDYWAGGTVATDPGECIGCNSIKKVDVIDSLGEKNALALGLHTG